MVETKQKKQFNFGLIMAVYLLGIFMGAIDTGIVTPARTIIQNNLGVSDQVGIWMITIYTLAYAASIPIMGKLADKYGRKYVYLVSIILFGLGSLFCGLSQGFDSFTLLLVARVVQAIGGGGILPVATAEFGTTFPKEKRGLALGLVGGVYGLANIFGSSAGSVILDVFGNDKWSYIFFINLPITLFIVIAGFITLPNTKIKNVKKIDIWGITTLTGMVLSLLYGLKKIDFFDFKASITSTSVYPFLIVFALLLPVFIFAERKAQDPVMNLGYFKNLKIVITLVISFITGIVIMGMIFVPQFSENALRISSGDGGYFVIILGVFAGLGAPFSGKLIDKFGAKLVLAIGFVASIIGALFLVFVTIPNPSWLTIAVCLGLIGIGIGFTMGTPLNYMMLENTKEEESNSALATVSLVRSMGTAIAPAIMIAFISHAGMNVSGNIMKLLPEVSIPQLAYQQELTEEFEKMKSDSRMASMLGSFEMPDLNSMGSVNVFNMSSSSTVLPDELLAKLQASDVTTITKNTKEMAIYMFDKMSQAVVGKIQGGIQQGIDAMKSSSDKMAATIEAMSKMTPSNPGTGMPGNIGASMPSNVGAAAGSSSMPQVDGGTPQAGGGTPQISSGMPQGSGGTPSLNSGMPATVSPIVAMKAAKEQIDATAIKMTAMKDSVPGAFEASMASYLNSIDNKSKAIEDEFQTTLNTGFEQVYLTVAIASFVALIILLFYKKTSMA